MKADAAIDAKAQERNRVRKRNAAQRITEHPALEDQATLDGSTISVQQATDHRVRHQTWMAKQARDKA